MSERIGTTCVQGGWRPGDGEPRQVPIYQNTTWKYDTSEHMGRLFDLEESTATSTRAWQNPTNDAGGGEDLRSWKAACAAMLTCIGPGGELLRGVQHLPGRAITWWPPRAIYGGTYNLISPTP